VDDEELLRKLRSGDESAFRELVSRYHTTLVRVARYHVDSDAAAEDVAQDTWIAVMKGVHRFEGRSSFKTWLFKILVNRARTAGSRDRRQVPVDPLSREPTVARRGSTRVGRGPILRRRSPTSSRDSSTRRW
jgi:RNA polymerase sigma-70 factor (ECF subfamily)